MYQVSRFSNFSSGGKSYCCCTRTTEFVIKFIYREKWRGVTDLTGEDWNQSVWDGTQLFSPPFFVVDTIEMKIRWKNLPKSGHWTYWEPPCYNREMASFSKFRPKVILASVSLTVIFHLCLLSLSLSLSLPLPISLSLQFSLSSLSSLQVCVCVFSFLPVSKLLSTYFVIWLDGPSYFIFLPSFLSSVTLKYLPSLFSSSKRQKLLDLRYWKHLAWKLCCFKIQI